MKPKWYVIASAAEARIYEKDATSGDLQLITSLEHPESRMKGSELSSDRPGHNQSAGDGHGSYVEKSSPKEYEAEKFAIEVGQYLNAQRNQNSYGDLCIAASPGFHGLLNTHMDKQVANLVSKHIKKDLTQVKDSDLGSTLATY
jgi:protein required for attachment to host cells